MASTPTNAPTQRPGGRRKSVRGACDNICHNVTKFASISHASTLGSFVTAVGFWRWCHRSCTTLMDPADGSRAVSAEIRRFCGAPGWTTEGVRVRLAPALTRPKYSNGKKAPNRSGYPKTKVSMLIYTPKSFGLGGIHGDG